MRWLTVVVIATSWACAPDLNKVAHESHLVTISATLKAGTAAVYNGPVESPPSTALGDALTAIARNAAVHANVPPPTADARLFRACAAIAGVVSQDGIIPYSALQFALQSNGIVEPSPRTLIIWESVTNQNAIVSTLQQALSAAATQPGRSRIGIAAASRSPSGDGAIVVMLQTTEIRTTPIPRSVPKAGVVEFDLTLDPGLRDPTIAVLRPDEQFDEQPIAATSANTFHARIECGAAEGKLQLALTAHGSDGTHQLAQFPVWCGAAPPPAITVTRTLDDPPIDPKQAEQRLFALINQDRQRAGRPALTWDDSLSALARASSEDMQRTRTVTKDPRITARAKTARPGFDISNNVARTYGVAEMHLGEMDEPRLHATLMSKDATLIGIGIAYGAMISNGVREVFVTELLASPPAAVR